MPSVSYDVVVSGDDLASVITATLCARRGLRTLLLAPDGATGHYALGPFRLPIDPVLWPKSSSAINRVMRELRIDLAAKRKFRDASITAQLVAPDFRIALTENMPAELQREIGEANVEAVMTAWHASATAARALDILVGDAHGFPGGGFFERRELAKLSSTVERHAHGFAHGWHKATEAHVPWFAALAALWQRYPDGTLGSMPDSTPANTPSNSADNGPTKHDCDVMTARALDTLATGVLAMRGDADALRELILERFTGAGGDVRIGRATDCTLSWGKLTGLTLNNGDQIGAAQWLFGLAPTELVAVLGKKAPRKLEDFALAANIVGYRYTLNLVIEETGLPEGMAPIVLSLPSQGQPGFWITVAEPDDKGRCLVCVVATVTTGAPLSAEDQREEAARLRRKIWQQLETIMPFFERHVVVSHSPHDGWAPMAVGTAPFDAPRGYPIAMRPIWKAGLEDSLGLGAVPYATGIKNLTLCGDQILPTLGIEGDFVSAWTAAKIACAIAGKKKDYLRDEVVGSAER